ncbi:MAG: ATP-binding protein [Brevundimonas sp.]|nr:ATP-binding protein [Brevundimonas sp.]
MPRRETRISEQILRIVNDGLQGSASGIGFVFGGTPEFLMDSRRGLYSYEGRSSPASWRTPLPAKDLSTSPAPLSACRA